MTGNTSTDELMGDNADLKGDQFLTTTIITTPPDATIKFFRSDLKLEAHKADLIAGSTFFRDYFEQYPRRATVTIPKDLRPDQTIELSVLQTALAHLHGHAIPEDKSIVATGIPLLLTAEVLGIASLETQVRALLTETLVRQVADVKSEEQVVGLIAALRELHGHLDKEGESGNEFGIEVGDEVGDVVAGVVGSACWSNFKTLKRFPQFMVLLREIPRLAVEMLASEVEMETDGDGVNGGESGEGGGGVDREGLQVGQGEARGVLGEDVQSDQGEARGTMGDDVQSGHEDSAEAMETAE